MGEKKHDVAAVIGAGSVGATTIYALMNAGAASRIILIDRNRDRARGEIMDLTHGASFVAPVEIDEGDYADCAAAQPGQSGLHHPDRHQPGRHPHLCQLEDLGISSGAGDGIGDPPRHRSLPLPAGAPLPHRRTERSCLHYEIIEKKGSTYYAIGLAVRQIVRAILRDESTILPVSTLMQGEYGARDVCLSLPCVVGAAGVSRVLELPLAETERQAFAESAAAMRAILVEFGY